MFVKFCVILIASEADSDDKSMAQFPGHTADRSWSKGQQEGVAQGHPLNPNTTHAWKIENG